MAFQSPFKTRAEAIARMSPQLVADVWLYSTSDGGRNLSVQPGWGCPCFCVKSADTICHDGWPILHEFLAPGGRRRLGFVFLHEEEAVSALRLAGTFYLWEGRFIGEATVVADSGTESANR